MNQFYCFRVECHSGVKYFRTKSEAENYFQFRKSQGMGVEIWQIVKKSDNSASQELLAFTPQSNAARALSAN